MKAAKCRIHRRLPKRGFNNIFRKKFVEVNLGKLQAAIDAGKLDAGKPVDMAALLAAGVISKPRDGVRILGKGQLTAKKLEIHAVGARQNRRSQLLKRQVAKLCCQP